MLIILKLNLVGYRKHLLNLCVDNIHEFTSWLILEILQEILMQ